MKRFYIRYNRNMDDGVIKVLYFYIGRFRLLCSWASEDWTTEGKVRRIPIWISKKGLFIYRLAIKPSIVPKKLKDGESNS